MKTDIFIIGDGIHAVATALMLAQMAATKAHIKPLSKQHMLIAGPHGLLQHWKTKTHVQGMQSVISPRHYQVASSICNYYDSDLASSYLDRFNKEAERQIHSHHLANLWQRLKVQKLLEYNPKNHYPFTFQSIDPVSKKPQLIHCKIAIMALGFGQLRFPEQISGLLSLQQHHPDKVFHAEQIPPHHRWRNKRCLIIGAGRTARTLARHIKAQAGDALIILRADFDEIVTTYYENYVYPQDIQKFREKPLSQRLAELRYFAATHRQRSATPRSFTGDLNIYTQTPLQAVGIQDGKVFARGQSGEEFAGFDTLVCATGYNFDFSHSMLLQSVPEIKFHDGYPELDTALQLANITGLYAVGAINTLRQGPAAKDLPMIGQNAMIMRNSAAIQDWLLSLEPGFIQ